MALRQKIDGRAIRIGPEFKCLGCKLAALIDTYDVSKSRNAPTIEELGISPVSRPDQVRSRHDAQLFYCAAEAWRRNTKNFLSCRRNHITFGSIEPKLVRPFFGTIFPFGTNCVD
jgi:hypothetical protein